MLQPYEPNRQSRSRKRAIAETVAAPAPAANTACGFRRTKRARAAAPNSACFTSLLMAAAVAVALAAQLLHAHVAGFGREAAAGLSAALVVGRRSVVAALALAQAAAVAWAVARVAERLQVGRHPVPGDEPAAERDLGALREAAQQGLHRDSRVVGAGGGGQVAVPRVGAAAAAYERDDPIHGRGGQREAGPARV
eukprot:6686127-Prymnesium_polylepis.2